MPQFVETSDLEKIVRALADRIQTLETRERSPWNQFDVPGTIRAMGQFVASSGAGLETSYSSGQGRVESVNRGAGTFSPLVLRGSSVEVIAPSGLILPGSSIHNILSEAVFIGNNTAVTSTGGWQIVPQFTTASVTCSGAQVLAEYAISFQASVAGAGYYVGIGMDSTVHVHFHYGDSPFPANAIRSFTGNHRMVPSAGSHTFNVFLLGVSGGTWTMWNGGYNLLRVTELKS